MVVCVSYVYFRIRKKEHSFILKRKDKKIYYTGWVFRILLTDVQHLKKCRGLSGRCAPINVLQTVSLVVCQTYVLSLCFQTEVLYEIVEHNTVNIL